MGYINVLAKEFNTEEDAVLFSENLHSYCIENISGYAANKYADPYCYNNKYYIFIDDRVSECDLAVNLIELSILIPNLD